MNQLSKNAQPAQSRRNKFLSICCGLLVASTIMSCSGKTENNASTAEDATTDTTIMGIQGDTTSHSLDGPIARPADTTAGQTLPEVKATPKKD
ncbi:hypothetical protein [Tellurirhabdus bombi]|uniref:hypothetical protein n=1 Tax=Tellurirhabdus bombi TaxID=2907205 RepID=UPI001F178733|nr:hypothetical protein [Tellurirhabdus bombi]